MKSKPIKPQNTDIDEDSVEVEAGGPGIAAAKKSKIIIIAASTVLTVVVFYFFFFKGEERPKEQLEAVEPPKAIIAPSDAGKSPFEFDRTQDRSQEDVELLARPAVPEVPTLPELPKDAATADQLVPNPTPKNEVPSPQLLPTQQPIAGQQFPVAPAVPGQPAANSGQANQVIDRPTDPRYAPIIVFSGAEGTGPSRGVGYENNIVKLKKDPLEELEETKPKVAATYISDRTHTIAQGKLLTAVLETAINTEIPGSVRAIVGRDVFGESGNEILIPKGSRLFGAYSSEIKRGQGRVQINWTRLIRPDGVDLAIAFNASDQFGRSGISGDVDNKYSSVIANSLLTSILAVGGAAAAQSLIGNNTTTTTTNPTQGSTTTTGNAANQALYDVTKTIVDTVGQIVNSTLDLNPVIRVPQGTRITVIVNADIKVPYVNKR